MITPIILRNISEERFIQESLNLGSIVDRNSIKIIENKNSPIHRSDAVEWHTDSAEVKYLAWRCIDTGEKPVGLRILASAQILSRLTDEEREYLSLIPQPYSKIDRTMSCVPVYSDLGFFFCKRHIPKLLDAYLTGIVNKLDWLTKTLAYEEIVLAKGDVLILPNFCYLHSRGQLEPKSTRELDRICIA